MSVIRLRCEIAVPSGLRKTRLLVRLEPDGPDALALLPARGLSDATHQLVDAAGVPLLTHLAERDPGVAAEIARSGLWELPEALAVLAAVRPGSRVVDIGAQVGYYAVLASRAARATGRVYAFDPGPDHHLVLAANAALSALLDPHAAPIVATALALSDRPGNVRLYLSDRAPGEHTTVAGAAAAAIDTRVVAASTVDVLRWPGDGPPTVDGPVDVLKIDVAGDEAAVLRGAERTLAEDRPVVAVTARLGATGPDPGVALIEWLAARGYGAFRLVPPVAPEPYLLLAEAARLFTPADAVESVRRKMVPPQFALLGYPEPGGRGRPVL